MCIHYLNRIFGGADRHSRRNTIVSHGGPTPLNSLANVQQLSLETTSSLNTSGMITSSSSKSILPSTVTTLLPERPTAAVNDATATAAGAISMASSKASTSTTTTTTTTKGSKSRTKVPNSWWTYLGMNKNKKTSIESL